MYWNMVNNGCYEYCRIFHHAPNIIIMCRQFYEEVEKEMYGVQYLHLIKRNSIRGLKIYIDNNMNKDTLFIIKGKEGCEYVQYK